MLPLAGLAKNTGHDSCLLLSSVWVLTKTRRHGEDILRISEMILYDIETANSFYCHGKCLWISQLQCFVRCKYTSEIRCNSNK